jgi:hypothetical protein
LRLISKQTRISLKYLQAIEANEYHNLPPAAFTKGFIQNFAKAVDLNPTNMLAIFRRDYDQDNRGRIIPRGLTEPVTGTRSPFLIPATTSIVLSAIIGIIIIAFFIHQITIFVSAPDMCLLLNPKIMLKSFLRLPLLVLLKPQAALTINNRIVNVSENGEFSTQLALPEGEHTLIITSTSRSKKATTVERSITVIR